MESNRIQWIGNPLSAEGTRARIGDIEAELIRVDPMKFYNGFQTPNALKRAWVLNINDKYEMRVGGDECLACVMLIDMLPERAKKEAEQILEWAAAARRAASEGTDTRKE